MQRFRASVALTASTAFALVLVGCGGSDTGTTAAQETSFADRKMGDYPESPLSEYFGGGAAFDAEEADAENQQMEQTAQEAIRDCMVEQGFSYVPFVPDWGAMSFAGGEEDLTQREYTEKHGFGIAEMAEQQPGAEEDPYAEDPNVAITEGLSESARLAYEAALYGDMSSIEPDEDGGIDMAEVPEELKGCQQKAYDAQSGGSQELWSTLDDQFMEMEERITADKRAVDAMGGYTTCMKDAGYDGVTELYAIQDQFYQRWDKLQGFGEDPFANLSEEEMAAMSAEEMDALMPEPVDVDPAELEAFKADELKAAKDDLRCREDVEPVMEDLRMEYEADFVEKNRDVLEQIKAAEAG